MPDFRYPQPVFKITIKPLSNNTAKSFRTLCMTTSLRNLQHLIQTRTIAREDRHQLSEQIYQHVIANSESITRPNFTSISPADLGLLFQINDELFFDGLVGRLCEQKAERPLSFRLSTRMTNAGGTTTMFRSGSRRKPKFEYEITIATTPLFGTFSKQTGTGVQRRGWLALQRPS